MTTRSERLNRLATRFHCETAWEAMEGDGCRRWCATCRRHVFDLAQLTPRQIRGHLEASRGELCGRLTRQGGRLVTAPPEVSLEPAGTWVRRRASAVAATLVTAWLTAGGAEAAAGEPSPPGVSAPREQGKPQPQPAQQRAAGARAGLAGEVMTDSGRPLGGVEVVARNTLDGRQQTARTGGDGSFRFASLPAGIYDLEGSRDDFTIEPVSSLLLQPGEQRRATLEAKAEAEFVTMGDMGVEVDPLRRAYLESDLVIAAVVGPSTRNGGKNGRVEVATELRIEALVKGSVASDIVSYRHSEYMEAGDALGLAPGTRIVALLTRGKEVDASDASFEAVDFGLGIKELGDDERRAYLARLEALARIEDRAERSGEVDPADLAEWLVATAEEPLTRAEATGELEEALAAVGELAEKESVSAEVAAGDLLVLLDRFHEDGGTLAEDPPPAVIGASLTVSQRERLTAALEASEGLGVANRGLFGVVRAFDAEAAMRWLVGELRAEKEPKDASDQLWWLVGLANELGDEQLADLAAAAEAQEEEIVAMPADGSSVQAEALVQEKLAALYRELRTEVAEVLAAAGAAD